MNITTLGIDLSKEIFELCGADATGKIVLRKRLSRTKLTGTISKLPVCNIVMEACGSANYWGRKFTQYGHKVKLIAPQYVKPFVKGNKNDSRDAEAIVEAASRPEMRYVSIKTVERQDVQSVLRVREGIITMRTKIGNQMRGLLAEYGLIVPLGIHKLRARLPSLFDREIDNGLSVIMKDLLETQYCLLLTLDERLAECDIHVEQIAQANTLCKRFMTVPGVGIISAAALYASIGNGEDFKNGRHLSAFLGLVPRQHSSGGKERLLGISKRGDSYLRQLLIHGARSVVLWAAKKDDGTSRWINSLNARRGINKTCVAVANKNARIILSILHSGESYKYVA